MDVVDFETWWRDFLAEPRVAGAKDGGYGAAEELTRYIAGLALGARAAFLYELSGVACHRSEGWGLALAALEKAWSPQALARIGKHVSKLKASVDVDDQSTLSAFLRVLASSFDPNHRAVIAEYLLEGPIGQHWSSVPWALWPDDPDLFGRSWARYFSEMPEAMWGKTALVQAFLSRPDALVCVRDALRATGDTAWTRLRDALLRQVDAPWLKEEERRQVRFVCGVSNREDRGAR